MKRRLGRLICKLKGHQDILVPASHDGPDIFTPPRASLGCQRCGTILVSLGRGSVWATGTSADNNPFGIITAEQVKTRIKELKTGK